MYSINYFKTLFIRPLLMAVSLLIFSGCATSHFSAETEMRMASNLPDHFLVGSHSDVSTSEPTPDEGCRNPMVDPRDGTKLELVRSNGEYGDYKVSEDRYGVERKELIRIECSTGRAVGLVKK